MRAQFYREFLGGARWMPSPNPADYEVRIKDNRVYIYTRNNPYPRWEKLQEAPGMNWVEGFFTSIGIDPGKVRVRR